MRFRIRYFDGAGEEVRAETVGAPTLGVAAEMSRATLRGEAKRGSGIVAAEVAFEDLRLSEVVGAAAEAAPAFAAGWRHGYGAAKDVSAREVAGLRPEYSNAEVEEYLEGFADGRRADEFRLATLAHRGAR